MAYITKIQANTKMRLNMTHLTFDQVLDEKLGVMDLTAICLCRDHNVPLQVFDMNKAGALLSVVMGEKEGTHVTN